MTFHDRFFAKVDKTATCWTWLAYKDPDGYGHIRGPHGNGLMAHRASWELSKGSIPAGIELDHVCHNRSCVNPDHLRLATRAENNQNLTGSRKNNTSGHRGVKWSKQHNKWRAAVIKNGIRHEVGLFEDIDVAAEAVKAKRRDLFIYNPADVSPLAA